MKNINLMYGNDTDDVDILCVPDRIADHLEEVVQTFFQWMSDKSHSHDFWLELPSGCRCLALDTTAFIWWLNNFYLRDMEYVSVVKKHTKLCNAYPIADF